MSPPPLCARSPMAITLPSPPKVGMVSLGCPKSLGRFRAHPDQAALGRLRSVARLCRRRRRAGQHLRLPRFRQGGEPRGDRRGDRGEWPRHRHRLHGQGSGRHPRDASRRCSRSPGRSNTSRWSARSTSPRRCRPRPISNLVPETRAQAHAAPLQLSEDFRGLQPPLRLLHHPVAARRSRQPPARRDPARGGEAGRGGHQGTAGHQPGHLGLWRRPAPQAPGRGKVRRGARAHDRSRARARQARRLGAAALRLSLSARRPGHPADGGGAGPPLSRHPLPACLARPC